MSGKGGTGETRSPAGEPEDLARSSRSAPDDEFDRALRSLTESTAPSAGLREPSAAERGKVSARTRRKRERARKRYAKLEKKDRKQERKQRKKNARKARSANRGHWSGGRGGAVVTGVIVVAVLGVSVWLAATRLHLASLTGAGGPNDTQVVTNGAVPSISPISPVSVPGPPADPFAGTPADNWADGAAGIVVPRASPVGEYSTAQVRQAYETTRKLLVAAALDKRTLLGAAPTAFAKLLSLPDRTQFVSDLNKIGLDKGMPTSSRAEIVSFAPGTTKLIGSVIKVHGTMSAHATTDSYGARVLEVDVNYLITYAIEPPRAPGDWMRVVAHFDGPVTFGDWSGAQSSFTPWWEFGPSVAGTRCSMPDGFQHPDFPSGPPDTVAPSGPAVDPYSLRHDNSTAACERTTGT